MKSFIKSALYCFSFTTLTTLTTFINFINHILQRLCLPRTLIVPVLTFILPPWEGVDSFPPPLGKGGIKGGCEVGVLTRFLPPWEGVDSFPPPLGKGGIKGGCEVGVLTRFLPLCEKGE
jgi:hypothetical protein